MKDLQPYVKQKTSQCSIDPANSKGKRESYLQHKESGTKMPLMYDMLPSSTHIISALEKRVSTMDKKERKEIGLYIARIYKKL